ncbi:MAG: heptosyltransferase-2 [Saprospiraceae bacterium]|jgi:heptosyltransferase-2
MVTYNNMASQKKVTEKKILIIGPSWVGDMMMAQSLFMLIKQHNPSVLIDVLAPSWSRSILCRMPEVNRAIDMPIGHGSIKLADRRKLGLELRLENYTQSIVLPNSIKSALIPWFAKIPHRTGWKGEMRYGLLNDLRRLNKKTYPLMVERFASLALPKNAVLPKNIPYPVLMTDNAKATQFAKQLGLTSGRKVLALCPGAEFGPSKKWPEKYYAAVAASKIADGWQVWLLGSQKDKQVGQKINNFLPLGDRAHSHNLAGVTQLDEAIELLSIADAVVSNDSGLMHISAALGRPLVALYGSTSPEFTPPLNTKAVMMSIPVDCGPCFKRECPIKNMKCLEDLLPAKVISELSQLVPN